MAHGAEASQFPHTPAYTTKPDRTNVLATQRRMHTFPPDAAVRRLFAGASGKYGYECKGLLLLFASRLNENKCARTVAAMADKSGGIIMILLRSTRGNGDGGDCDDGFGAAGVSQM